MQRVIQTVARHPGWILCLTAILTIAAFSQLPKLQFEISIDKIMGGNKQALARYATSQKAFSSESVIVVYLEDTDLFAAEKRLAIQSALNAIDSIPGVKRTVSLLSPRYLRTTDEYADTDPYLKLIPKTRKEPQAVKQAALDNPLVRNNLLTADGKVMAIDIYIDSKDQGQGIEKQFTTALNSAIEPLKLQLDKVSYIDDPSIKAGIMSRIRADQKLILPLSALILLVTLGLILRRPSAVIVPMMTAGLSLIWILGLMAAFGISINALTVLAPALIIIVGSTEDIHLITEYQTARQQGAPHRHALWLMAKYKSTAVFLTFTTTCIGFLSIAVNRIDLLAKFGLITSAGLLIHFLITITLLPVCMQWCKRYALGRPGVRTAVFEKWACRLSDFTSRYSQTIIEALLGTLVICTIWAMHTEINNNVMNSFDPASEEPQQTKQALSTIVEGAENRSLKATVLPVLKNVQEPLKSTDKSNKSISFASFTGVVHQARILVRYTVHSDSELNQAMTEIHAYAEKNPDASLAVEVTDTNAPNHQSSNHIINGQGRSLFIMILMLFLLVTILFKSLKAGFVAVVASLFPIIVLFGILGFFRIPLDTGTIMVGAISIGICIDHTIHFLIRYQNLARQGLNAEEITREAIRLESTPIMATTLALTLGFATLSFSSFPPIARFGTLSAMVMLLALISTFFLIPLMMQTYRIKLKWNAETKTVSARH